MRKYIALFFVFCIVVTSCKKPTDSGSPPVICHPLPDCNSPIEPQYFSEGSLYSYVTVNTQNFSELLLWKESSSELIIYNTANHSATPIASITQVFSIRWRGEWILYSRWVNGLGDGEIYKIRRDGTDNQLLTSGDSRFLPTINPAGNRFLYDATGGPVIMDFDGNIIKKVVPDQNINIDPWDWYNDSLLLCRSHNEIFILNMNNGHLNQLAVNPNEGGNFGNPIYIGNNQCLWYCVDGIKKTDMTTGTTSTFVPSCNAILYATAFYNPATGKILCLRKTFSNKDNNPCKIVDKTELIWLTVTGDVIENVINIIL